MITEEELARWEKLAAAISPGCWRDGNGVLLTYNTHGVHLQSPNKAADAAFIAHAQEAVPLLIAEVRRLRAERDTAVKERRDASASGEEDLAQVTRERDALREVVNEARNAHACTQLCHFCKKDLGDALAKLDEVKP